MILQWVDWVSVIAFFVISLIIGISVSKKAGSSSVEFFASGRNMPWWLLGVSMVATTFSTDTPNLVSDLVRQHGVSGNWMWWAFLLTGMVTVFIYARLWRRSGVLTDIEFYELRYSGKAAAFLRGFRALYLGVFFNVIIMASVSLAAIKIGGIMLGFSPLKTILISSFIVVIYTMLGGLRGVIITDFVQFIIAMTGSVAAAYIAVNRPEVGGLSKLLSHESLRGKLSILPDFSDTSLLITVFIIPIAVQWWSVWYPGAEPGGGGYIAQRMLAAKNEKHAVGATFFFNIAHYALRPWPWIIVALASLIVFPDLEALRSAFPQLPAEIVKHDLAYPAMLTFLPAGLLGVVVASLIAAFMSTISTHLNWGASYIVNDFYKRFIAKNISEKQLVMVGRASIVILMALSASLALLLENALQAFHILLQIGAGTGLLFLLRWFWWRINAASEIAAMVISFLVAVYFEIVHNKLGLPELIEWQKLIMGVGITTVGWITFTFLTKPTEKKTLLRFYRKIHPGGPGWRKVLEEAKRSGEDVDEYLKTKWSFPSDLLMVFLGLILIYSSLFGTGFWIYGNIFAASITTAAALLSGLLLLTVWKRCNVKKT
jgi:Na+/proline symporter